MTSPIVGFVPGGTTLSAVGDFTGSGYTDILWKQPDGSYLLWQMQKSGIILPVTVALPPGYSVVGAGNYSTSQPGISGILLRKSGALVYAVYAPAPGQLVPSFSVFGTIGSPIGGTVVASGNFNTSNYFGNSQALLLTNNNSIETLRAIGSNLPAFTVPAGFTMVPGGVGNFFGADLPAILVVNAAGTVEILMEGGNVTTLGVTTNVVVSNVLGTLRPGETIVAVGGLNRDGSTDVITQQSGTLSKWVVDNGVIVQTLSLGPLPSGFAVTAMGDFAGNGASDLVLVNGAGAVKIISGTATFTGNTTLLDTAMPVIVLDGNYSVMTHAGTNSTLSNYFAALTAGISPSATGVRILTIQQGALASCSFEQVTAGNLSLAAWQQNVATLNAIAKSCRDNGITVQVETQLGWAGNFGAAQTYQWLNPALAAGLPIGYVVDDQEFVNWQSLNIATMVQNGLPNVQIIHAALPDAVFGEWEILGGPDGPSGVSPYHQFLQNWYTAVNGAALSQGLPGISFIIADQYYSAELLGDGTVSETGLVPHSNTPFHDTADLIRDAAAVGVKVEIQVPMSDMDLNPLQALARQELQISQEARLGIAGIQLSGGFNSQPVSSAVNLPGSTFNAAAEVVAITPFYTSRTITANGPIRLTAPSQIVMCEGATTAVVGASVSASTLDQENEIVVVLIDQTGTLSASQSGGAKVIHNGSNILILSGTPGDVAAELGSLTISEAMAGPDSIDVEVFGASGRVAGKTINVLATQTGGSVSFLPSGSGTLPQLWQSASAVVSGGTIVSETFTWPTSNGLSSANFIGGATIIPITEILVDQPLMEQDLHVSGGVAHLSASDLAWTDSAWGLYNPINPGVSTTERIPVAVAASTLLFDRATGTLQNQTDTLAPIPQSAYGALFPFTDAAHSYYFADGGLAVTQYNSGSNPYWPGGNGLYANGAGSITLVANGPTMVIAYGSTNPMVVDSIQTITGTVNGATRVLEVRYRGGADNPYDEVDQIFNPYSATPELWQQLNTVGIPVSMAGNSPLPIPSATTIIEYNTGDNPNWNTSWGTATVSAATFEAGNWDSTVMIAANGSVVARRGVTWLNEGKILNAYTLAAPTNVHWTANTVAGTGIAGDWVVVTSRAGQTLGSAQVAGTGMWQVVISGPAYNATVQQFDLVGDSSPSVAPETGAATGTIFLRGLSSDYIIASNAGSLYVQDLVAGRDGTVTYGDASKVTFSNGTGLFDPTGSIETIARLYQGLLDRAPDVDGLQSWAAQADDANVPLSVIAGAFASAPEFIHKYGRMSDGVFVEQLYQNLLNRASDLAGGQAWTNALASGVSRGVVASAIAESPESRMHSLSTAGDNNDGEVYRLYQTAFDRTPDLLGAAGWASALSSGMTVSQVAQAFIDSAEFMACGALRPSDFVPALYHNALNRAPCEAEAQAWVNVMQAGASKADVMVGFSDSIESRGLTAGATHANWVLIPT